MSDYSFENYLPESVRSYLENTYYGRVNEQARLENLISTPGFWQGLEKHPAFFSDHGVVHVRDVAQQILQVLKTINGVLIPFREAAQMESFLYGYGAALAYLHDIGMCDLSPFGRAMHPEYATLAVFNGELDAVVDMLWEQDSGHLAARLEDLYRAHLLKRSPKTIFRELLALSVGHSKSKIPMTVLDDPVVLRAQMQLILSTSLSSLYRQQQAAKGRPVDIALPADQPPHFLSQYYNDFQSEGFDWLVDPSPELRSLVCDVTDTIRALRCADALRQRGTVQKTSGGYEVFVSPQTGNALFALRLGSGRLYLMEMPNAQNSVGEANLASSEFSADGNLRLSFHRGAYDNDEALHRSVHYTAFTVNDFLYDVVDSFWRNNSPSDGSIKTSGDIRVLLESTDDNPRFTELLHEQLCQLNPELANQIDVVPSLRNASELERERYLASREFDWSLEDRQALLERVRQAGQKITNLNPQTGFRHVRVIDLRAGETLIEAGASAAFVYLPLGDGLRIIPLGGYQSFSVAAWMPLGNTGVIRGNIRNADVVAEKDVTLLVIPREVYLRHWYAPYTPGEFRALFLEG